MEQVDFVAVLFRWVHILAAATAIGGTVFLRGVLLPSQGVLTADQRQALHDGMRGRWSKIVMAAIGLLLVSGLYNIAMIEAKTTAGIDYPWYRPLFALKFLLAIATFGLSSLLSGRSPAAEKIRARMHFWLNVNLALVLALVLISGILRTAEKRPKPAAKPAQAALSRPASDVLAGKLCSGRRL